MTFIYVFFAETSIENLCYISKTFLLDVLKLSIDFISSYSLGALGDYYRSIFDSLFLRKRETIRKNIKVYF